VKIPESVTLFVLTFFFGIQIVALVSWTWPEIPKIFVTEEIARFNGENAAEPTGIRVMYAGMEPNRKDETAFLRFVVYNGTSSKVSYDAQVSQRPSPKVYVNSHTSPSIGRCRSGMKPYFIEAGASAEYLVGSFEFERVPNKSDLITVGFYLRYVNSDLAEEIFSEPIVLPDAFRQSIHQRNKKQETLWAE
jgi:hypothetical protein